MQRTQLPKAKIEAMDKNIFTLSALDNPKLKQATAIDILAKCLGEKLLKFFRYGIVKGDVLKIYFSHPAVLIEFRNKKQEILAKMRIVYKEENLREVLVFREVLAFSIPTVPSKPAPSTQPLFYEKATGIFVIKAKDSDLNNIFTRIQKSIKESQK